MSKEAGPCDEEEVFVDAVTSPDAGATQTGAGLRRSARKRKSIVEDLDLGLDGQKKPKAGKRHRPLGKMGGVQRSPDAAGKKQQQQALTQTRRQVRGQL